jgi:hypothetical protein
MKLAGRAPKRNGTINYAATETFHREPLSNVSPVFHPSKFSIGGGRVTLQNSTINMEH